MLPRTNFATPLLESAKAAVREYHWTETQKPYPKGKILGWSRHDGAHLIAEILLQPARRTPRPAELQRVAFLASKRLLISMAAFVPLRRDRGIWFPDHRFKVQHRCTIRRSSHLYCNQTVVLERGAQLKAQIVKQRFLMHRDDDLPAMLF